MDNTLDPLSLEGNQQILESIKTEARLMREQHKALCSLPVVQAMLSLLDQLEVEHLDVQAGSVILSIKDNARVVLQAENTEDNRATN